jgi:hypothetical protein
LTAGRELRNLNSANSLESACLSGAEEASDFSCLLNLPTFLDLFATTALMSIYGDLPGLRGVMRTPLRMRGEPVGVPRNGVDFELFGEPR